MNTDDTIPIGIDDHVVEPPGLFDHPLDARWQDRAPRIEKLANGAGIGAFEERKLPNTGPGGRPPQLEPGAVITTADVLGPVASAIAAR